MALPIVHLAVAYNWAADKKHLFTNPEYYLGVISPDAIHTRPDSNRDDKSRTHLGINRRVISSLNPVYELLAVHNDPFHIGYVIHIITDWIWANYYTTVCSDVLDENGKTIPSRYYNDTAQVDYMLYNVLPYREFMFDMLEQSVSPDLDDLLTSEEIEAWKQRTLHWFENECQWKNPILYVTYEKVCNFIDTASAKINEAFNYNENIIYQ